MENFKLPIEYVEHKNIQPIIESDLEMTQLYNNILKDSLLVPKWISYYTTNTQYLKDTQQIIKHNKIKVNDYSSFQQKYDVLKKDTYFNDKYQYINIQKLNQLNYSIPFMQFMSLYNLSAPLFSIITPIFMLLVPFFILKFKSYDISIQKYIDVLTSMIKRTNIFKLFNETNQMTFQQKMSGLMSILFYIFQIYQNVISCIEFYNNLHFIYDFMSEYKEYCLKSIEQMKNLNSFLNIYGTYELFVKENEHHIDILNIMVHKTNYILNHKNTLSRLGQIGYVMTLFYDIHYNKLYDNSIYYSYYVNQYINDLNQWRQMYKNKKIKTCTFKKEPTYMKESYYLFHYKEKPIKNDIHIDKNIIITGPNASGKTTLLKSILLNIIFSQQIGFGCYKKANIHVYDYLHSYLNIPDTSDRDSLFQAEARRCKDILETINSHEKQRHFCIFDELYSGTNPNDAVLCATLYLKGLIQHKNHIDFVLTTHYIKLCEYFNNKTYEKDLVNIKMDVNVDNEDIDYLYKIKHGISYVHGGKKVLRDLDYPSYLYEL